MNLISRKKIQLLRKTDLPSVLQIQANAYLPELNEKVEVFANKLELFPQGCVGVKAGNSLIAYAFAHPWIKEEPVPLNDYTYILPTHPDIFYIHDVAVLKEYYRMGIAHLLVNYLIDLAQRYKFKEFGLVAVQKTESFWEQFGFKQIRSFEYAPGISATFMSRKKNLDRY